MTTASDIEKAVDVLRAGGLVALPTETVYGLGADAENPAAVARVYRAKGRPATHPLIVHIGGGLGARDPDPADRQVEFAVVGVLGVPVLSAAATAGLLLT